jgi:hypothetical protein
MTELWAPWPISDLRFPIKRLASNATLRRRCARARPHGRPSFGPTKFVAPFTGAQPPPGKDRWFHLQYDRVTLDDGTIGFVRNALDAEISRAIADAIEELFPEPAEDRH